MIDLDFIVDRFNYWIVIVLMVTGLYIVISRGNLVKKIVGLNIFQTSVFIYYISIGKVLGGTAPIFLNGYGKAKDAAHEAPATGDAGLHGRPAEFPDVEANPLPADGAAAPPSGEPLHAAPDPNLLSVPPAPQSLPAPAAPGFEIAPPAAPDATAADLATQAAEIVYTNPLPHVLILTAIVVGVATTAVGLALAVRIREAYGTIEEDELEAADNIAQYGSEEGARP